MIALQGLETLLLLKRRAPLLCQVRTCEVKGETLLESFRMLMDWDLGEGKSRLTTSRKTWQFAASNSVARGTPPGSRRSPGGIVEAYGPWGDNKGCSVMMIRTSLDSKNVRVDETISHLIIPDWECFRSDCNCNNLTCSYISRCFQPVIEYNIINNCHEKHIITIHSMSKWTATLASQSMAEAEAACCRLLSRCAESVRFAQEAVAEGGGRWQASTEGNRFILIYTNMVLICEKKYIVIWLGNSWLSL